MQTHGWFAYWYIHLVICDFVTGTAAYGYWYTVMCTTYVNPVNICISYRRLRIFLKIRKDLSILELDFSKYIFYFKINSPNQQTIVGYQQSSDYDVQQ